MFFSDCGSRGGPGLFVAENPSVGDHALQKSIVFVVAAVEGL